MLRKQLLALSVLGLAFASFLGCGGPAGERTFPVTGIVTQGGTPIQGAVVSFHPTTGEGRSATGTTDASGRYLLTSFAKDDGALPGRYGVTVAKYDQPEGAAAGPGGTDMEQDYEEDASYTPPSQNILPEKFANVGSSGFQVEVVAGENTHNFELEGTAAAPAPQEDSDDSGS